jgi:hypothetical protein
VLNPANWRQRIRRSLVRTAPGVPAGTTFHRLRHAHARCWVMPAFQIMRSSGGSATPTPARSARTAIPTPAREMARPPAPPIDAALTAAATGREKQRHGVLTLLTES